MFRKEDGEETGEARARLERGLRTLARRGGLPADMSIKLLDSHFADALMALMALVLERNEVVNLTAVTEPVEFAELQLLDSLAPAGLPALSRARAVVDVGAGAGFPGLPLALLCPEKEFLLIDSLGKRVDFMAQAAEALSMGNVRTLHARAEAAGHDARLREGFDLALCRAVAQLPVVLEYCLPLVRTGGNLLAYKTVRAGGEIEGSLVAREMLGAARDVEIFAYPDLLPGRAHALYIVRKEGGTPVKYPRREGVPSKVPL
ncbi:MAG: 16S rRNA (guanine(527)-N(7))-methyltransferase RsmG [Clostridiales Family XIII bacterium]|jgi:16S rRNA (guanine527-N7)-methyltransferase|nr:16S rRNA (guanine(527)-N(7))-methyltransferase RsmG [Clostridiales Family XIII bacterium]